MHPNHHLLVARGLARWHRGRLIPVMQGGRPTLEELRTSYEDAQAELETASRAWDELADDATDEVVTATRTTLSDAVEACERSKTELDDAEELQRSRDKHKPAPADPKRTPPISVDEPDIYVPNGRHTFLADLYRSQLRNDPGATARISRHQEHELAKIAAESEERAVSTGTLGGIIPPQYLVDMYAKASRNGRVFADQCNAQPLPDEGMSLIIPRLTTGTAAGVQAAEGDVVATQDPVEDDLTVYVRTIAGYVPVSRQTLERASYSEAILFEDLLARYWAVLDTQALTGSGAAGQMLGLFNTPGIESLYAGDNTIQTLWSRAANAKQLILTKWGGLGISPAKWIVTPRRWGQISSYLDDAGRPLFGYNNAPTVMTGTVGDGTTSTYGFVGNFQGLPMFTDANVPDDLGTNSDEDAIVLISDPPGAPLLWERDDDPVTLAFEQQAGTSLQVQLIAYGYAAFTAGRYPDASAVIEGFPTPTFE